MASSSDTAAVATAPLPDTLAEGPIPLPVLEEIADRHAVQVWGERVARGKPVPLAGIDGAVSLFAFPFAIGAASFPEEQALREEFAEGEARCRAAHETADRLEYPFEGRFGSIYVSAKRGDAPIQLVTSTLPPYYVALSRSTALACASLETAQPELTKIYYLNPHEQYFEFASGNQRALVCPHTMRLVERDKDLTVDHVCRAPALAIPGASDVRGFAPTPMLLDPIRHTYTTGPAQKVVIPNWELIPPVPWTWWCVATAYDMMAGFWDNFVPGKGTYSGFGRIIGYWYEHSTEGHRADGWYAPLTDAGAIPNNVPSITDELIDPATKTWRTGFNGFPDFVRKMYGYQFTTGDVPVSANNDYAWNDLTSEIDKGYPCFWSYAAHCVVAIGYRIDINGQKFVICLDTYYPTLQQKYTEHPHGICNGLTWMRPGGGSGQDNAVLYSPRGGEAYPAHAPAEVRWCVYGSQTNQTALACSSDAGKHWQDVATGIDTVAGLNTFRWLSGAPTEKARVRLKAYAPAGYLAGDGSFENFSVRDYCSGASWERIFGPVGVVVAGYDKNKCTRVIYATEAGTGNIYQFQGKPGQTYNWFQVGGSGKMFVLDGQGRLYGLSPDSGGVFRYNGTGTSWTQIGGPAAAIYADVDGVLATNPQTGDIYRYKGAPFAWIRIGGPGRTFACDSKGLVYSLSPDGSAVWRYDGLWWTPVPWVKVGGPAADLFARGLGVFATNPQNGDVYMYQGIASRWSVVGGPGKMFSVDVEGRLYGLSPDGSGVCRHRGSASASDDWEQIGGPAATICAGWRELLATNPQTGELWIYTV